MALELAHPCPICEEDRTFYRSASTNLHLGLKTKWTCSECGYGFVQVDGEIDSTVQS